MFEPKEMLVPTSLWSSRGLKGIHNLARSEPASMGPAVYRLYVVEIDDPRGHVPYSFYVGHTKQEVEDRVQEHQEGGLRSARIFKREGVSPGSIRYDLFDGLPRFRCKACAENAEGRLARVIEAQAGRAKSDMTDNRKKGAVRPCEGRVASEGATG